ncbi:MAG: histidine kinase [Tannerella sp.]|nr:histidine kinase [Tannerella sp.]
MATMKQFTQYTILILALMGSMAKAEEPLLKSEYSYRQYTVHDGLPEMICLGLYQDSNGFIWIGLLNGFARFDGYTFHPYMADSDEGVVGFYENAKGNVSGIALRRVHEIDAVNDTVHTRRTVPTVKDRYLPYMSQSMPAGYGVYQVNDSRAVFALTDSGLVKIWEHEKLNKMHELQKPYWDRKGKQFLLPTEEGVYVIGENGIVVDSFPVNTINCFIPYKNGFRAVGDDGIYEYVNHSLQCIFKHSYNSNVSHYSILEAPDESLIIRMTNTIFRLAGNRLETVADNIAETYDMCIDREGNLWVATAEGVYNFYRLEFKNHILSTKDNYIRSVLVDRQDRVWLASTIGDLVKLEHGEEKKVNYPNSPTYANKFFVEGAALRDNDIYIPGSGSILHYNNNSDQFDWLKLEVEIYRYTLPLPDGDLVVGTYDNTYIYRPGQGIIRRYDISQMKQMTICAETDKQGRIWLGGVVGVVIIDGDSMQYLTDESLKMCRNMVYDRLGRLWLTCRNNLVMMTGDQPAVVHSFPNTLIRSLYFTRNNVMIVGTIDALYLSKNTGENLEFIRYDQYNGFNGLGVITTPMAEDKAGNVWTLSLSGAVKFNPEELLRKQLAPLLHIQTTQSSADNINWTNVYDNHSSWNHRIRNVKFNYVAMSYSAVENVRYHYRLLGFQNQWSEPTKQREITFNNLSPGNYTFEIYADAGADESRCETQSFTFSIQPAFWQTAWFITACITALMLLSSGIALYIQRRKNKVLLEKLNTEKELNELTISSIRLKSIPHFNANVLSAIEYYIMNRSKDDALRLVSLYSDFTYQTLLEVDKAARSLDEEIAYVKMYLELEKVRFIDKFDFRIDIADNVDKSVQLPNMILHTYCENALKHGLKPLTAGGLLTIRVLQHNQIVCVDVEDNGVGRNYITHKSQKRSSKQGLPILNRQIEIYNRFNTEKIEQRVQDLFKDEKPVGTIFSVEIPINYAYIN